MTWLWGGSRTGEIPLRAMLARTALRMMSHEATRYAGVTLAVAMALFLVLMQSAFYFGFRRDITVVPDSFDADLWVSQRELLAFDYAAHFDDLQLWQTRDDAEVRAAAPVIIDWPRVSRLSTKQWQSWSG